MKMFLTNMLSKTLALMVFVPLVLLFIAFTYGPMIILYPYEDRESPKVIFFVLVVIIHFIGFLIDIYNSIRYKIPISECRAMFRGTVLSYILVSVYYIAYHI